MTSISPPVSLATFSTPHASSSKHKHPHVQLSPVTGGEGQLAVAAVQGDGIWTYDLSTLRPTTSFTVPPRTIFNSRPISFYPPSRIRREKQKADGMDLDSSTEEAMQRITVVGIHTGEGLRQDEQGRGLWLWKGEEGQNRSAILLDKRIHSIARARSQRAPVFIAHPDGSFTALDSANHVRPVAYSPSTVKGDNTLLAFEVVGYGVQTVRVATIDRAGNVGIIEFNVGGPKEISGTVIKTANVLEGTTAKELAFAEISEDGVINGITTSKILISRSIKDLTEQGPSPHLVHPSSIPPLPLPTSRKPLSVLAVSNPSPTLLLVSSAPNLPAILATSSLSTLTPTASASISALSLLARPSPGTYICGVTLTYTGEDGGRSVIYTFEVVTPDSGVGMNLLLNTQATTAEYLQSGSGSGKKSKIPVLGVFDSMVADLKDLLKQNDIAGAEEVFRLWLENEEKKFMAEDKGKHSTQYTHPDTNKKVYITQDKRKISEFSIPEGSVRQIVAAVFDSAFETTIAEKSETEDTEIAAKGRKASGLYAPRIIGRLISRRWVHDSLYPGGVVQTLIDLEDWSNLSLAIKHITTIPSSSLLQIIRSSIAATTVSASPADSLESILRETLALPAPPPDYRNALRAQLSIDDATSVLKVYAGWLAEYVEIKGEGLAGWEGTTKRGKDKDDRLPPLESIITHSSHLLDSHLPRFLTHAPSHQPLEDLQRSLTPLIALQESYRRLRAPVEAVLTLSRREARKVEERENRKALMAGQNPNKRVGAQGGQQQKGFTGVMPEEVVGKYKLEEFVF